jgi:ankyrin repeat protein
MWSVWSCQVVRTLLEAKADPNLQTSDADKASALLMAAQDGFLGVARLLLAHGALVDLPALGGER